MDSGLDREDFVRCVECVRSGGDFVVENRIEVISANVGPNRAMGFTTGDIVFVVEKSGHRFSRDSIFERRPEHVLLVGV